MKNIFVSILLTIFLLFNIQAQDKRIVSMQTEINRIKLGLQHNILSDRFWAEVYIGIGNQDLNNSFDDLTTGLDLGFSAFSNKNNRLAINSGFGLYIPNNNYYSATVPILNVGVRYSRFFGKRDKHCLFVSSGYQFGKKDYKQDYYSDIANISTIGTFKIQPLYFSIGYGFCF